MISVKVPKTKEPRLVNFRNKRKLVKICQKPFQSGGVVQDIKGYRNYEQEHPKDILDALDIFTVHITGKDHQKKAMDG